MNEEICMGAFDEKTFLDVRIVVKAAALPLRQMFQRKLIVDEVEMVVPKVGSRTLSQLSTRTSQACRCLVGDPQHAQRGHGRPTDLTILTLAKSFLAWCHWCLFNSCDIQTKSSESFAHVLELNEASLANSCEHSRGTKAEIWGPNHPPKDDKAMALRHWCEKLLVSWATMATSMWLCASDACIDLHVHSRPLLNISKSTCASLFRFWFVLSPPVDVPCSHTHASTLKA